MITTLYGNIKYKIDIVYLEYVNIGLLCNCFIVTFFLRFKKAQKADIFLHIAFLTQNTKTLIIAKPALR